jgi:hypothetical protein
VKWHGHRGRWALVSDTIRAPEDLSNPENHRFKPLHRKILALHSRSLVVYVHRTTVSAHERVEYHDEFGIATFPVAANRFEGWGLALNEFTELAHLSNILYRHQMVSSD